MPRKRLTRFLLWFMIMMSGALIMIVMALPFISDTPHVKRLMLEILSEKIGIKIEAEHFQIRLIPQPKVAIQKITLTEQESGKQRGTVEELDFEFKFLSLVSQPLVVTHGAVVKPVLMVEMDSRETPDTTNEANAFPSSSMLSLWNIRNLRITQGQLTFSRPADQGHSKLLPWSDIEITISSDLTTFPIAIQFSGNQATQTGPHIVLLTGKIDVENGIRSSLLSGETQENLPLHFTGHLQANDLELHPIMTFITSEVLPTHWSVSSRLHTPIDMVFDKGKWFVTFSNMEGQINNLRILGKGHVIGETGSKPSVFFQGSFSKIAVKTLQDLLLPNWLSPDLRSTLLHHQVDGEVEIPTATIAGSLNEEEALSIIGTVKISEGRFQVSPDLPPVTNVSSLIVVEPQYMTISEILADYGSSKLRSSKVHITFPNSTPEYTADLRIAWDARDVVNTMIKIPQSQKALISFLPIEEVHGEGELSVQLQGPLGDLTQTLIQEANVRAHHVGFRTQALPMTIKDWSGTAHWIHNQLSIEKIAGSFGNSQVEFSGIFSNPESPQLQNGMFQAETNIADIWTLYPEIQQPAEAVSGKMEIVANIAGPLNAAQYNGRIDLQNLTLSFPSLLQKPRGVPAWLEFSGTGSTLGTFVANSISLNLPPFALGGQGQLSTENGLAFEGTFHSQSVDVATGVSRVVLGDPGFSPDHLDVSLDIQGASFDWTQWQMAGFLAASETDIPEKDNRSPPKELTIQANLQDQIVSTNVRTDGIALETIMGAFGNESPPLRGKLSLQGTVTIPTTDQHLATESSVGDVTFLISNGHINHIPVVSRILGILNLPSLLMGKVNLLEEGMPFNQITGTVSIHNGILNSKDVLVDSPVMKLSAAGNYDLPKDHLDIVVAASPFGAYSDLLQSIPLFGQLLKGKRQGLATALFTITGSTKDPKVQYQPLESFAGGVTGLGQLAIDVLTNFIKLPQRAITPTQKDSPKEKEQSAP